MGIIRNKWTEIERKHQNEQVDVFNSEGYCWFNIPVLSKRLSFWTYSNTHPIKPFTCWGPMAWLQIKDDFRNDYARQNGSIAGWDSTPNKWTINRQRRHTIQQPTEIIHTPRPCFSLEGEHVELDATCQNKRLIRRNFINIWAKKRSTQSGRPLKGRFDVGTNDTVPYIRFSRYLILTAKH